MDEPTPYVEPVVGKTVAKTAKTLALIGLGLLLSMSALIISVQYAASHRVVLRNASGSALRDVRLVIREQGSSIVLLDERQAVLPDGDSVSIRHSANDTSAALTFVTDAGPRRHDEGYIDLWAGEGWNFVVNPSGEVESGSSYLMK